VSLRCRSQTSSITTQFNALQELAITANVLSYLDWDGVARFLSSSRGWAELDAVYFNQVPTLQKVNLWFDIWNPDINPEQLPVLMHECMPRLADRNSLQPVWIQPFNRLGYEFPLSGLFTLPLYKPTIWCNGSPGFGLYLAGPCGAAAFDIDTPDNRYGGWTCVSLSPCPLTDLQVRLKGRRSNPIVVEIAYSPSDGEESLITLYASLIAQFRAAHL